MELVSVKRGPPASGRPTIAARPKSPALRKPGPPAYAENYLYVSNTGNGPYVVYKIHCPSIWQRVEGTSIGRVKALFR